MNWDIIYFIAFILHVLVFAFVWFKISKRISNKLYKNIFTAFIILTCVTLLPIVVILAPYFYVDFRNDFVEYMTRESNKRHPITLGENQRITVHIKNPLPVKMDYRVGVYLKIKDKAIKTYPHTLERPNKSEEERIQAIASMEPNKGAIYPIRMHVTGYTFNRATGAKDIFFQDDISNKYMGDTGAVWMRHDNSFFVGMHVIFDISRGDYYFDIEDVSKKIDFFDEIEASVQIEPLNEGIH